MHTGTLTHTLKGGRGLRAGLPAEVGEERLWGQTLRCRGAAQWLTQAWFSLQHFGSLRPGDPRVTLRHVLGLLCTPAGRGLPLGWLCS